MEDLTSFGDSSSIRFFFVVVLFCFCFCFYFFFTEVAKNLTIGVPGKMLLSKAHEAIDVTIDQWFMPLE